MKSAPKPSYTLCFATAVAVHGSAWLFGLFPQKTEATFFVAQSEHLSVELIESPDEAVQDSVPEPAPQVPPPAPAPEPEPIPESEPEPQKEPEKNEEVPAPEKPKPPEPTPQAASLAQVPPAAKQSTKVKARTNPDYYRNPPPPYPEAARRAGITGLVVLYVLVGIDGKPLSIDVKSSSGSTILDRSARNAVRGWRFQPARVGDKSVEDDVEVPIRFSLTEADHS